MNRSAPFYHSQFEPAGAPVDGNDPAWHTFDVLPVAMAIVGANGTIKQVNRAWRRFARYTGFKELSEVVPGVNYLEVCRRALLDCGEEARRMLGGIEDVLLGKRPEFLEEYPCPLPGVERWHLLKITRLEDSDDTVMVHLDITERKLAEKALRKSEERYRRLYEDNPTMYFTIDMDGTVLSVNSFGAEQLGYTPEELVGKPVLAVFHPDDRDAVREQVGRCMENPMHVANWEFRKVRKDGSIIWVREAARAVWRNDGTETVILVVCEDITAQKAMEEKLRINAAKLERSNQEVQEFAFIAAHDLQEPLRKIQLFSSMLQEKGPETLEENLKWLKRMQKAAIRMQYLIGALMDYAKIAVAPRPFRTVSIKELIEDILIDLEDDIQESGACVEVGELHMLDVDRRQMRQLFYHLIANALQYRAARKPVIRIYGKLESGSCTIFVEDNGIGFHEKYLDRIFKPFQRLHSMDEGRMGMGLAICRKIVEHHNGMITARSKPGHGSTFIIKLPLRQCEGPDLGGKTSRAA
ncbi:MAG: sensor histidine kinase [Acidobacteriota bacterium]